MTRLRRRTAIGLGVVSAAALAVGASFGRADPPGVAERADETVVLLHGLGRSAANMLILEWRLEALGYRVCNVGYDTRVSRIEQAVEQVRQAVVACRRGERALHFVTHSLGGLVLRALLADGELDRLGRAVMLAPPNAGSEIADRLRGRSWLETVMGPLSTQLGTGDDDLPRRLPVPTIPFGVIAGDQWINPIGPLWLPAPHDGTVSVESTRLVGMRDHLVMPYTHTFIMNASPVADQVDTFLRQGRFDRSSARESDATSSANQEPDPRLSWEARVSRRAAGKARKRSCSWLHQAFATPPAVMHRRSGVATSLGSGSWLRGSSGRSVT